MVPTKLTLSNFMCYRADGAADGPPTLDFAGLHVVCLSGENGAGKSALLDAITWALWGQARTSDDELIAQGQGEMSVELEFQLGDQIYRIIRRRQRGGTGKRGGTTAGKSQLDLQARSEAGWRPMGEISVRETQATLDKLLRMSYRTFINAAFLLQGHADEFTNSTPGQRKDVLAEILDLEEYEALAEKAKERAKGFTDQLKGLRGKIEQLELSAKDLPVWANSVQEAQAQAERMGAQVALAEQALAAAEVRLRELQAKADLRKAVLRELERLRKEQAARETEIATLRGRIVAAEGLVSRRAVIAQGVADLDTARKALEQLDTLRDQHDKLSSRQAELRQQFSEARGELRSQLGTLEQRCAQLEKLAARREAVVVEIRTLGEQLVALGPLAIERETRAEERTALDLRSDELTNLQRRHDRLESQIKLRHDQLVQQRDEQQRTLRGLDKQLADEVRWRQELATARAAAAQLAGDEAQLAALRDQEQREVDALSHQRAEGTRLKTAADKLKANQKLLADAGGACPVCRSELGETGVAHVQAHYETELTELRAAYSEAKRQADAGELQLKQARATATDLERQIANLRRSAAQADALERQLRQAETWQAERVTLQQQADALQQQIAARAFEPEAQAELATVAGELAACGDTTELAQQRKRLDEQLRQLDKRLRERDKVEGQRDARQEELARAETDLAAQPALLAEIAELRRVIEQSDFAHAIYNEGKEVGAAISALGYSPEAHAAAREQARDLGRWTKEEHELQLAEQRLDADRKLLAQTDELRTRDAAAFEQRTRDDALLEQELRALPSATSAAAANAEELSRARYGLQAANNDLGEKRGYLKMAQTAADQLERERETERSLTQRHSLFAELAEAFGKRGVQAMLIELAIPQIEDEANRLLGRMTDGQMHLSFDTQRDTKTTGTTIETLEIKIADALGTRIYNAFSGGEAMRVNFAVRIALSRLLARRAGARLETLVIDEGFGSLDSLGRERMVEAITSVQADFRRIIVITHIDELKDRFADHIEVTKTALGSRWELR